MCAPCHTVSHCRLHFYFKFLLQLSSNSLVRFLFVYIVVSSIIIFCHFIVVNLLSLPITSDALLSLSSVLIESLLRQCLMCAIFFCAIPCSHFLFVSLAVCHFHYISFCYSFHLVHFNFPSFCLLLLYICRVLHFLHELKMYGMDF